MVINTMYVCGHSTGSPYFRCISYNYTGSIVIVVGFTQTPVLATESSSVTVELFTRVERGAVGSIMRTVMIQYQTMPGTATPGMHNGHY